MRGLVGTGCKGWLVFLAYMFPTIVGAFPSRGETTFFPLPEIIVDPHEGTTLGALAVVVVADEVKRMRRIVAPDVRYNDVFGVYPAFRYFEYPTMKQKFFLSAGKSEKIDEYAELSYSGVDLLNGRLDLEARLVRDRDSRERFYGIGNDTSDDNESNYTGDAFWGRVTAKWHLPDDLRLAVGARGRGVRVRRGGVHNLPYTAEAFTVKDAPGLEGETILGVSAGLWYDTRDLPDTPLVGSLVGGDIEFVDAALGSTVSYQRVRLEGRTFRPVRQDGRVLVAARAYAEYLHRGEAAPFYELSSLGGVGSLRGFGSHRFRDRHRLGGQLEVRSNVYERDVFGVRGLIETTPFLDVGKVFRDSRELPLKGLHVVPGVGLRAVVRPQVVAYVDLGFVDGNVAAFTGIDYPF